MLIRNLSILSFSLFSVSHSFAQTIKGKGYTNQLTFIEDNDNLAFKGTDRYYTNGSFLLFSTLRHNSEKKVIKQINEWEIGQQLYTAYTRRVHGVTDFDRPIAGYLYGKFTKAKFKERNQLWKYGISVGTVGPSSHAKDVNNFKRNLLGLKNSYWNWIYNYQIKDEMGANLHGTYAFSALKDELTFFQITPETNVTAGTSLANISQSVLFQLGTFNPMQDGGFWNAKLSENVMPGDRGTEFFFFYQPQVVHQFYNAAIQGGMFRSDKGATLSSPKALMVYHNVGAMYSARLWTASFQYISQSKEVKTQQYNHSYGRIKVSYRFK